MRESVGPALKVFSDWVRSFALDRLPEKDVSFFMLAVQSVLFMSMLESPFVEGLLGGTVQDPGVRARVRRQVIQLVVTLLGVDSHRS
jgi:hypothetical protein